MATADKKAIKAERKKRGTSVELGLVMKNAGLSHFFKIFLERDITQVSEVKALADAQLTEIGLKKGHGTHAITLTPRYRYTRRGTLRAPHR